MLEQLENQEGNYAIVQELLQDFELIVDSFEQAVERPRDNDEQKRYYSGKRSIICQRGQ
ncbi:MAG: transposase family protein [Dolichospermum sp. UKL201]|jgi:molecular chaperone GrpE (heat shock protein)|nr:MAG: transposase family protein [Dolichospermum sp. UKL201]